MQQANPLVSLCVGCGSDVCCAWFGVYVFFVCCCRLCDFLCCVVVRCLFGCVLVVLVRVLLCSFGVVLLACSVYLCFGCGLLFVGVVWRAF